jgi:threonine/homoserine/homoserine lactone efflux protein
MIAAFVTGLLLSFLGSMTPTGPIALIVLKYGMRGQRLSALLVAAGGALAEAGYALLAYLGITFALSRYPLESFILRLISGIILIGFAAVWIAKGHSSKSKSKEREYIGTSFLLGLSIAGLNPTFIITWAGVVAIARSAGLISAFQDAPAFAFGVASGPVLWFWILLTILNHHSKFISSDNLAKIEKALPFILLILGAVILIRSLIPLIK